MEHKPITPLDCVRIAGLAMCDPRTARAYVDGRPTRPSVSARIEAAVRTLGWVERLPRAVAGNMSAGRAE